MNQAEQPNQDNSIKVEGSVYSSPLMAGGEGHTVIVKVQQASLPEPGTVDIQAELKALHEILLTLKDPGLDDVVKKIDEEAKKPSPDKSVIGTTLETGLKHAKTLTGFVEAIDNLRPHVEKVAAWLGEHWYKILPIVGLKI